MNLWPCEVRCWFWLISSVTVFHVLGLEAIFFKLHSKSHLATQTLCNKNKSTKEVSWRGHRNKTIKLVLPMIFSYVPSMYRFYPCQLWFEKLQKHQAISNTEARPVTSRICRRFIPEAGGGSTRWWNLAPVVPRVECREAWWMQRHVQLPQALTNHKHIQVANSNMEVENRGNKYQQMDFMFTKNLSTMNN